MSSVATATAQHATAVVSLSDAVVTRGVHAWSRIKSTAAEQRQLWREVGEALRYGRALHKADRAFAQWVREQGFSDIKADYRTAAMWLAQNWDEVVRICSDLSVSNPVALRKAHREAQTVTPPSPELSLEGALLSTPTATQFIEKVAPVAKKVNKLAAMAERGEGQEKATAQKYLDKKAKELGLPTEELVELGQKLDPEAGIAPHDIPSLQSNVKLIAKSLSEAAAVVKATQTRNAVPISKAYALSLFLEIFNTLEVE